MIEVVPAQQAVPAPSVDIESGAPRHEDPQILVVLVVNPLQESLPAFVLVEFIQHHNLVLNHRLVEDSLAILGQIPVVVFASQFAQDFLRQMGFPHLTGPGQKDEFLVQILQEMFFEGSAYTIDRRLE